MDKIKTFKDTIRKILDHGINNVYFASNRSTPPILGYVVNFPRLSVTIEGENETQIDIKGSPKTISIYKKDAVFVPSNCWDKPTWSKNVKLITFLFGRKNLGISIAETIGGEQNIHAEKIAIHQPISGGGLKILDAIIELKKNNPNFKNFPQLIEALIEYCLEMIQQPDKIEKTSKSKNLVEEVCTYLQENFQHEITRDSVAKQFNITPNHLSRIFKTQSHMKFNDYLKFVRIDRAKFMLSRYDITVKEVAARCGYNDTGYFCKIFKKTTRKTPTNYKQYIRKQIT